MKYIKVIAPILALLADKGTDDKICLREAITACNNTANGGGPDWIRFAIAGAGYGEGEDYDAVYSFFDQGNAWTFSQLQLYFQEGPIDWRKKREEALESVRESER